MKMQENNLIWNCIKKSKISRNIFNQRSKRYILWKLWSIDEGIWKFFKEMKKKYYLIGKINVVKISILLKAVYRCNASGAGKATVTCLSMNWEHVLVAYTK